MPIRPHAVSSQGMWIERVAKRDVGFAVGVRSERLKFVCKQRLSRLADGLFVVYIIVVGGIALRDCRRDVFCLDLTHVQFDPVHASKPRVVLDLPHPMLEHAVPLGNVSFEQMLQEVSQLPRKVLRHAEFGRHNFLVDFQWLLGVKGRISRRHLVDEHSKCPPVDCMVVTFAQDDLRRKVLWCTAERPCSTLDYLGETKVCYSEVSPHIKEKVLRFEIPVNDVEVL
mmetsp:Transcript_28383/g.74549  ORF Transcript_28383/g.74549 Transcript_28383/m.74549 type:complete len:226 (-) Transcript_28383:498-1175(-)